MPNLKLINPYRFSDVLQLGFAEIVDREIKSRFHLPIGIFRNTYGSRLSDALQSRSDIDTITHQVAIAFLDNVAEMNTDAKFNAALWRHTGIALDH